MIILLLVVALAGCSLVEEVEIVQIVDEPRCAEGVLTIMDTTSNGRMRKCGRWGKVGDKFNLNLLASPGAATMSDIEIERLRTLIDANDAYYRRLLYEKDQRIAQLEAEVARLKEELNDL